MKNAILLLFMYIFPLTFAQEFTWQSLPLGGGGFLTGIVTHPAQKDLIYARTDVGGVYKYQSPTSENERPYWQQLMNWIPVENMQLWSCDGIALNPFNVNEVYALLGQYLWNDFPSGVYKSDDQGKTWHQLYETKCGGNENNRWIGEPIAVQPAEGGKVIIAGTRQDGVIRSDDGGSTWSKVASINPDPEGLGVRCVVFDPQNPDYVYAVDSYNVYRSQDAGRTFTVILSNKSMRQAVVTSEGRLYVTTQEGIFSGNRGEIPMKLSGLAINSDLKDINAITVDIHNPKHLVVAEQNGGFNNRIYRTTDGGNTWNEIARKSEVKNNVPWYEYRHFAAALASLKLDPFYPNKLWFTDWYLPWKSEDISLDKPLFETVPWGVEELVVFDIISPSNDALLYQGCADNGGFTHYSLTDYPTVWYDNQESTGIDFCEAHPEYVVRVSSLGWGQSNFKISLSSDCGKSWKTVGGNISTTGKMAYSSKNVNNFIWAPTGSNQKLKYTLDGGATAMKESSGLPAFSINGSFWDNYSRFIASDRINGDKFYVALPGQLYISTDGGASFTKGAQVPGQAGSPAYYLTTSPYEEGVLWLSTGQSGLRYSSDSGRTLRKVGRFTSTKCVTVGPPLDGNIPVVYVFGRLDGVWGMYASYDNGENWTRINSDNMQLSNNPRQLSADRNRPGRVYLGTGGVGIIYGECQLPATKAVPPVISPAGGKINSDDTFWITAAEENAEIYYTTDGSEPTVNSKKYTAPVKVESTVVVKAMVVSPGKENSSVAEVEYQNLSSSHSTVRANGSISVYPVPVEEQLTVSGIEDGSLSIYDAGGQVVYQSKVDNSPWNISFGEYASGLYFLKHVSDNDLFVCKVIKK